ncbi:permease [Sphingomonas sp.]|uniref:cell division protein FtsX n=1 Tax=Sphingomonas sp. TaxID=28214 RepID=UPI0025E1B614|nr:permease [Sphingomonas sp.]MBV9526982.1 permease [Sphingomonas sp.]
MMDWLFASSAERRLLGGRGLRGATPWLIGIMSFTMVVVAAAGLALANTASLVAAGTASRYSVQVPDGAGIDRVAAAVRATPGASSVESVPAADMRKTLERWLGPAGTSADLPVPGLVTFDAPPSADLAALRVRVAAASSGAQLVAHRDSLGPVLRSLRLLQWLSLALVLLLGAAAAAAVVLASRGALDTHRFTIEVMHGVGATDVQVTRLFQRRIALDALTGSIGGAILAAGVLLAIAAGASFAGEITGGATLTVADLIMLGLLPFGLTAVATWVARATVLATLRQAV